MANSSNLWVLLGLSIAGIVIMTAKKLKKVIKEDFGAFIQRIQILPPPPPPAPPKAPHPLTGLNFAVSDVFDIDGYVTGFGNPDWAKTHEPAARTSPVILSVVEGGATCTGKTVLDEMALSISGVNMSYDTPTNPAAPAYIPGGASSGSAVAVSANLVEFSLDLILMDVTGFGNPDWAKTHEPAARTSPVILSVVEGGATCAGKTVLDEMALSISGVNMSYDTPTNPAAPAYIPGGASSGSAVAVSANLVEFSLGI